MEALLESFMLRDQLFNIKIRAQTMIPNGEAAELHDLQSTIHSTFRTRSLSAFSFQHSFSNITSFWCKREAPTSNTWQLKIKEIFSAGVGTVFAGATLTPAPFFSRIRTDVSINEVAFLFSDLDTLSVEPVLTASITRNHPTVIIALATNAINIVT